MPFKPGQSGNPDAQFKPGQSGNPDGYPLGVPNRATVLKRLLSLKMTYTDPTTQEEVEGSVEEAMVWGLISKATQGDTPAYKEVMDSVYGKQTEKIELETKKKVTVRLGGRTTTPPPDADAGN